VRHDAIKRTAGLNGIHALGVRAFENWAPCDTFLRYG
jgi:hypothetical protein